MGMNRGLVGVGNVYMELVYSLVFDDFELEVEGGKCVCSCFCVYMFVFMFVDFQRQIFGICVVVYFEIVKYVDVGGEVGGGEVVVVG